MDYSFFEAVSVFLSSNDGDGYILVLLGAGPAAGVWFFKRMHRKYRNFDVTHHFEKETDIFGEHMQKSDVYYTERKRTRDKYITGRNSHNHRARTQEF